jgi:hypothetical protein
MGIPAGATSRAVGASTHFNPIVKTNSAIARSFLRGKLKVPAWMKRLYRTIECPGAYELLHGFQAPALPSPMNRGEGIRDSGFGEFTLSLIPATYKTDRIPLHHDDKRDSMAPVSLQEVAEQAIQWLAAYEVLVFHELIEATPSTYLSNDHNLQTMFGGTALYSDSHSYFGQTLDNNLASSGNSLDAVRQDLWLAILRRREFVDSNGIPFQLAMDEDQFTMTMIVPPERQEVVNALMRSDLVLQGGATAPSSNYTRDYFKGKVEAHVWDLITDADAKYLFFTSDMQDAAPLIMCEKEGLQRQEWREEQSDWARATRMEGMRGIRALLFGLGHIWTTIKIS